MISNLIGYYSTLESLVTGIREETLEEGRKSRVGSGYCSVTGHLVTFLFGTSGDAKLGGPQASAIKSTWWRLSWNDAVCINPHRSSIKCCRNLRIEPRFCEVVDCCGFGK